MTIPIRFNCFSAAQFLLDFNVGTYLLMLGKGKVYVNIFSENPSYVLLNIYMQYVGR